jgi:alpha-mannosidase
VRQAIAFNQPLIAATEPSHNGPAGHSWSFASIDADDVYITALKRAEQTNAYVLRLVEWHGRPAHATVAFGRPVTRVRLANLLEDPAAGVQLARDRRSVTLTLRPWEIVTLLVDQER